MSSMPLTFGLKEWIGEHQVSFSHSLLDFREHAFVIISLILGIYQ
jgi:hypothetical protein